MFYSKTNHRLNYLEEAERGFKKTLELGGTSLDIWIQRGDVLIELGEIEAAKYNFVQALEYYPESEELEFRLSGLCFKLNDTEAGFAHLLNGLHINSELWLRLATWRARPNAAQRAAVYWHRLHQ